MSKSSVTSLQIAKFGGISMANFDAMNRSADIISSNPAVRLVVLSASAGVTDLLIALSAGNQSERHYTYYLDKIRQTQFSIIQRLINQTVIQKKINQMINSIAVLAETSALKTSPELTDELISYGELMSTLLFVEVLRQKGITAEWFDVRKVMYTNSQFGQARPDCHTIKVQIKNILLPLLKNKLLITQGFIGRDKKGRTTTLGRGSSDYTATLLGEALEAKRIDIWTDVCGIYTADPHIVPQANRITEISFEEASNLAVFGAKILHPETLLPAMRRSIPVFIGSSKHPDIGGTLIYNRISDFPYFCSIALRRFQTLLTLHSLHSYYSQGFLTKVFNTLGKHAIAINLMTVSAISVTFTINTASVSCIKQSLEKEALLHELSSLFQLDIEENLALVTLISSKLRYARKAAKQAFNILHSYDTRLIYYGSNGKNFFLLVQDCDAELVVRILHDALFDKDY